MPKGEVPNLSEQEAEECLHCAIIDMVEEKIAAGGADAASLAALIAESLVDVILRVPEEEQARLMAHTLTALGDFFLRKAVRTPAIPGQLIEANSAPSSRIHAAAVRPDLRSPFPHHTCAITYPGRVAYQARS
jgi:hypothetical protein